MEEDKDTRETESCKDANLIDIATVKDADPVLCVNNELFRKRKQSVN